jgi:hypothetical protein
MKRVVVRIETTDKHPDGTITTSKSERIEESGDGLLAAATALLTLFVAFICCALIFKAAVNVSSPPENHQNNGTTNQ